MIPGLRRSPKEGIGYPLQYSWASMVPKKVKNPPAMWETLFDPWLGNIPWRRAWQPTPVFLPGESPWATGHGVAESDMTERLSTAPSAGQGRKDVPQCPPSCSMVLGSHGDRVGRVQGTTQELGARFPVGSGNSVAWERVWKLKDTFSGLGL